MIAGGTPNKATERAARKAEQAWKARGGRGSQAVAGKGYDVTGRTRLRPMFQLISAMMASPDRHLDLTNLAYLREMCRAHDRQGSLFSGVLNRAVSNIVGPNFSIEAATGDRALDQQINDVMGPRMEASRFDAAGILSLRQYLATALRAVWNDGEAVAVKVNDGSIVGFEADQIVTPSNTKGARVVLGVELNNVNRPTAYWLRGRQTVGDYGATDPAATDAVRVPAPYVLRPAYRTRFGQTRGVPFLASILGMYERLDSYIENESLASVANAMASWKITREAGTDMGGASVDGLDGIETNDDGATSETFEKIQQMEPLSVFDLGPGEDMEMVASNRPGPQFEGYTMLICRLVGAGIGFPLELLLLDFSKTSFSSARASLSEAQRNFRFWQGFLRENACDPWWTWQVDRAIAAGDLPADPRCYFYKGLWPAWNYVDPWRESQANDLQRQMLVKSRSQIIRESGREPEDVFDEIAEDERQLAVRGIATTAPAQTPPNQLPPIDEDAPADGKPVDEEAI